MSAATDKLNDIYYGAINTTHPASFARSTMNQKIIDFLKNHSNDQSVIDWAKQKGYGVFR